MLAPTSPCPCGRGEPYESCCGRFHRADAAAAGAPTAEALMRSRYAAFAVGDAAYLLRTWHPSTRPSALDLDPDVQWRHLLVLSTTRGGPFDDAGTVEFEAHSRRDGRRAVQHEDSAFTREGGRWYYVAPA